MQHNLIYQANEVVVTDASGEVIYGLKPLFPITVEANVTDPNTISDGYHTFSELYEHRNLLFITLLKANPLAAWRATKHWDGTFYEGWFIAGIRLRSGCTITYHLPADLWQLCDGIPTYEYGEKWDGHTARDVADRLRANL